METKVSEIHVCSVRRMQHLLAITFRVVESVSDLGLRSCLLHAFGSDRKSQCQNRDIAINAVIAVFASSWSLSSPMAGFQPMLAAMVVYFFRFRQKLDAVFPSPTADKEEASRQNNKKMIRSFGLAMGSVALGALMMQTVPFLLREYLNVRLPFWFIYKQQVFTNVVSSWTMFVMSSFYR